MKKFFMVLAAMTLMVISAHVASAQNDQAAPAPATEQVASGDIDPFNTKSEEPLHQQLKTKFIEGGAGFMALIIICLIIGLALAIERILYLSFSKTNTKKLVEKVEAALADGGIEKAKDVCRNTRGPVASIFYQGISLFIAIAPSLGFLGTVIGMIQAFDAIQAAGDISPNVVAGGMKVALITTVGGLIVALILQVFYNYILAKIDSISIDMEDSSIALVDALVEYNKK